MPLLRYFIFTGGVLLALLFLADRYTGSPENAAAQAGQDLAVVRIHSAQQWPEKIVFDTSAPQVPAPDVTAATAPSPPAPERQAAQPSTREAFAMAAQPPVEPKRAAPPASRRNVAQRHYRHSVPRAMARDQTMFYGQFYGQQRLSAGWW
ncbi:hypothetical protein AYJ54_24970 [Bradyrhizobium centrolobii]|uniref:Uncharacterized protein n=1 Tax=Bradyrhizobium centrolobii TaxID=1505087 RepID=A0A176YEG7_9BRAD|nr:hypothetical protein [Bradyrhizobium centrolobii]OAF02866.1 hypothetical protein AYJ54_24970 [Bradyrhizobium centrolobii]